MKKLLLPVVLLISACSTAPLRTIPPPVVDDSAAQTQPVPGGYPQQPLPGRSEAPAPRASTSGAVVALLDRADAYRSSGDSDNEAAAIERALRIDPNNARLWSRLASVRLDQEQPGQAEQLAMKSNALAGADNRLQAHNWRLIAAARRVMKNSAGAREAERKAAALQ